MDFLKPRYVPMNRRRRIYEGKAKILFEGPEPGTKKGSSGKHRRQRK